ncbi:hypothetical protein [Sporolactobacillus pectinivorans]|uniref:hypothetical protein n=1 Tax=Sporolactobacillus pectinivorans TaxID=1591408 RepID=UPI000C26BDD7|nr:hypothetical protein [Sporolactobacillus pectinivorans]
MIKKKYLIILVAVLAVAAWTFRVYQVNHGVAKDYQIKTYQVGKTVPFDSATFKVTGFSYGNLVKTSGFSSVPLSVEMEVHNTSDKSLSIIKLIETKLAYGYDYYQTREGNFNINELRQLPPKATAKLTLRFDVDPKYKGKRAKLYIDQSLYGRQVLEKYKNGVRYGIYVHL